MSTPIGSASITIEAVTDAFQRSLTTDTDRVLRQLRDGFEDTMTQVAASVTSASHRMEDAIGRAADQMRDDIRASARSIETSVQQSAQRTEDAFERATDAIGANADRNADRVEQAMRDAATDMSQAFRDASQESSDRVEAAMREMRADSERTSQAIEDDAEDAGNAIGASIGRGVAVANAALALLRDGADDAFDRIGRGASGILGTLGRVGSSFGSLAGTAVKAFLSISKAATAASLGIAAFAQAVAGAVAVMEQLAGIAVIAPAAILSLVAVTKTLTLAFQGFGDALSASVTGDMEAFTEAINKLSPAAQTAIIEMSEATVRLQGLQEAVQDVFFAGLSDDLGTFSDRVADVALTRLPQLSRSLSEVARGFLQASNSGNLFAGVDAVLAKTATGVSGLAGPITRLTPAFGDLFLVGSGFIDRMYASLGRLIDQFATFVSTSAGNGALTAWAEGAIDGFQSLGRTLGNIGSAFGSLTEAASSTGAGILATIERVTGMLADALGSDKGQAFLTASFALLAQTLESLFIVLGPLVELFAVFATGVAERLTTALQAAEPALQAVAGWIGTLTDYLPDLNDDMRAVAEGGFSLLVQGAVSLYNALSPLAPLFVDFGRNVGEALSPLGGIVTEFAAGLEGLTDGFDTAWLDGLVNGFGLLAEGLAGGMLDSLDSLLEAFAELGRHIPAILPVIGRVAREVGSVLGTAVDQVTPLFSGLTRVLTSLTPVLDTTSRALRAALEITGGLALALMPLVQAFATIASGIAAAFNPQIDAVREAFRELQPLFERVGELVGTTLVQAFEGLRPGLDAIVAGFVSLVPKLVEMFAPIEDIIEIMAPLIVLVAQLAGELIERLAPYVFRVIGALIDMRTEILEQLVPVLRIVANFLVENLRPAFEELLPIVEFVFGAIARAVEVSTDIVVAVFKVIKDYLDVVLPVAFDLFATGVKSVWDIISTAVSTAWFAIKTIFDIIKDVLSGDFAEAWRGLQRLVSGVFEAISSLIGRIIGNIVDFITGDAATNLANAMWGAMQSVYNTVVGWMGDIGSAIGRGLSTIAQWFMDLPGNIWDSFTGFDLWGLGWDLITGFINGLIEKAKGLPGTIIDWVVNPVKDALSGIGGFIFGSPSKLMKKYGGWVSEGFAVGIGDAESDVVAAAESLTRAAALPGMITSTGLGVSAGSAYTPVSQGSGAGAGMALFGPGAVQVTFSGAVPSEREAYVTGQAVGAGIADEIARRNARVAVGVL